MRWRLTRAALVFLLISSPSLAAEFVWGRHTDMNSGVGTLYMIGQIVPGDYDRFVSALRMRRPNPFSFYLRSGGGDVAEALRIGRLVRQLSVPVYGPLSRMPNPNTAYCGDDEDETGQSVPCICASACTLIWFGGVSRVALEIYIHSVKYNDEIFRNLSPMNAQRLYQQTMQTIHVYLTEMGIPDKYYDMMMETGSSDLQRVLTPAGCDLGGWPPSYREWLYAKCGDVLRADPARGGTCMMDAENEAEVDGLRQFFASSFPDQSPNAAPLAPTAPIPSPVTIDPPSESPNVVWSGLGRVNMQHTQQWMFGDSLGESGEILGKWGIFYVQPGSEMRRAGVAPNTLFFEGRFNGQILSGKAATFRKECGGMGFDVSGAFSLDANRFVLVGTKPTRNQYCRVVSHANIQLVFERVTISPHVWKTP